jgi:hypothetical protein
MILISLMQYLQVGKRLSELTVRTFKKKYGKTLSITLQSSAHT